jgi:hypothetical protein
MEHYFRDPLLPLTPGPFRLGDRVRLMWGFTPVEGVVVEDRGNRGRGGKRFYRVRIQLTEQMEIEREVDDLTLVPSAPTKARKGRQGEGAGENPDGTKR